MQRGLGWSAVLRASAQPVGAARVPRRARFGQPVRLPRVRPRMVERRCDRRGRAEKGSSVYRKFKPTFSPCTVCTTRPRSDQRSICAMFCENSPLDRAYWSLRRPVEVIWTPSDRDTRARGRAGECGGALRQMPALDQSANSNVTVTVRNWPTPAGPGLGTSSLSCSRA